MAEAISPINIAALEGDTMNVSSSPKVSFSGNPFEDILNRAVSSLEDVSQTEFYADKLINQYIQGQADVADVMMATSKMNIMVQLAVSVVNSAVSTFKEVTQMQV